MKKTIYSQAASACYISSFTMAITINLAPILFTVFRAKYDLSFEQLGRLIFICFMTQIIVDTLAIRYANKIGYRICAVGAQAFIAVGLVMFGLTPFFLPPYFALGISIVVYSIGSGLIEVIVSPIIDSIPSDAKASDMAFMHSFYCWGQVATVLISTLLLAIVGHSRWFILPLIWAVIPVFNFFNFIKAKLPPPLPDEHMKPLRSLFGSPVFYLALALMICAGASELSISQWASLFAERALGISKVTGDLLGPCLFATMMGIGRVIFSIMGKRIRIVPTLAVCAAACVGCYLVTALSPNAVISMVGLAAAGLTVSIMWPATLCLAAEHCPGTGTALFAVCALFGDFGCSIGPYITGAAADIFPVHGLRAGLTAGAFFPVLMLIFLSVFSKRQLQRKRISANITSNII